MSDAPELTLRIALAELLLAHNLVTWDGTTGDLAEKGVKVDGDFPTSKEEFTFLSSPPTTRDGGRSNVLYRVQFLTRRIGALGVVEKWAYDLSTLLDMKEYVPSILGISLSRETSRAYFDQNVKATDVAITYAFRGRRS